MQFTHNNLNLTDDYNAVEDKGLFSHEQLVGEFFSAPTGIADNVDGVVVAHNTETGHVTLATEEGQLWHGYEHQLE